MWIKRAKDLNMQQRYHNSFADSRIKFSDCSVCQGATGFVNLKDKKQFRNWKQTRILTIIAHI